jgi:hypothetical protein
VFSVSPKSAHTAFDRQWLKHTSQIFQRGFICALKERQVTLAVAQDAAEDPLQVGVFIEGASMACTLMDMFMPWRNDRWQKLFMAVGDRHPVQLYLGRGMAISQANQSVTKHLEQFDELLSPFVVDGYAFHSALFGSTDFASHRGSDCQGHLQKVLDQGIGRSYWFASGGNTDKILAKVANMPESRHRELWVGLGVASAYAGGSSPADLSALAVASGHHRGSLGQGAVFAAYVRNLAGNQAEHTNVACKIFSSFDARQAAKIVEGAFRRVRSKKGFVAYHDWQSKVRKSIPW